jgi:ribonuclease J
MINQLKAIGAHVLTSHDARIHCSGHALKGELRYIYNVVRPKNVLPIHGEVRHLLANAKVAEEVGIKQENIAIMTNGATVEIRNSQIEIVSKAESGYVYVDGKAVDQITEKDLDHRRILRDEGFVAVTVTVDLDAKLVITKPKIVPRTIAEDESVFYKLPNKITKVLNRAMTEDNITDLKKLSQLTRRITGSFVARNLRRSPMILPIVCNKQESIV